MLSSEVLVFTVFVVAAVPLLIQDARELAVDVRWLLVFTVLVQGAALLLMPDLFWTRAWQSMAVLIGGGLFLLMTGGLGEADVIVAANLGVLFGGFNLPLALAWGCLIGIVGWAYGALRWNTVGEPFAFLPALCAGACVEFALVRMVTW